MEEDREQSSDSAKAKTTSSLAAHLRRVNALERRGMYEEAAECLKRVIALEPGNARYCIRLANLYRAQRKIEPAIAAMRQAIDLDPRNAGAHESLLQIYLEIGRYDEAIAGGKKLLRGHPRNLYARDILGLAYLQKGLLEEAMAVTNELINLDPMDAANHFKKAILFQRKGVTARAIEEFIRVVEMDPDGDISQEARDEIAALDGYQLHQIVTLAAEDPMFRARLNRDPEAAVRQRGFSLSYTGLMALRQIELDALQLAAITCQQMYYH